jgi:hypothetical protein
MLSVSLALLSGLIGLAPLPRPAPSLPEVVFEALCKEEVESLRPYCVRREDWPRPRYPQPSGGRVPTEEDFAREAKWWWARAANEVEESVPAVRSYGTAVGFNWSQARLTGVRINALDGPGQPYSPKEHGNGTVTLALLLQAGQKELTLFVPVRATARGQRLSGRWAVTELTPQERHTFNSWRLRQTDAEVARLIARRRITKDYFEFNGFGGTLEPGSIGCMIRLPLAFDKKRADSIDYLKYNLVGSAPIPYEKIRLVETGADTLSFAGVLEYFGSELPIRLTLDQRGGPEFARQDRLRAHWFGEDREFFRVPNMPGTFRAPDVEVRRYGNLGPEAEITFVDGVARELRVLPQPKEAQEKK